MTTILFWSASVLAASYVYPRVRAARPSWEFRAELVTMLAVVAMAAVVLAALVAAGPLPPVELTGRPPRPHV